MTTFRLLIPKKSHHLQSICSVCCDTGCFCFFSVLFTNSHIYELFCLRLSLWQTVPDWDPCMQGGWAGLIGAEGASGSATGTLNITCRIDTTSGLLFSLCNWADNVPWFPLFCTSVCSAWAARRILVSWKRSGVSKRSGYPPPLLQFCRWADGIATAAGRRHQRAEFIHCPGPWGALLKAHWCNKISFLCDLNHQYKIISIWERKESDLCIKNKKFIRTETL